MPSRRWLLIFAGLVTVISLSAPIAFVGIWDPHELRVAELSRRIACTLLGATDLALEGANNSVPDLGELARGQLPFTCVALGFRLFGLHEWAGRLPLVIWGLLGVVATAALVARLSDRVTAAFAALALSTMPLYFLHARTILGDIVTMASVAVTVAGLAIATFDTRPSPDRRHKLPRPLAWLRFIAPGNLVAWRWPWLTRRVWWLRLGLLGLLAGFGARGLLIGIALPALGVGLSWAVLLGARRRSTDRFGHVCGAVALGLGAVALGVGLSALSVAADRPDEFSILVGAAVHQQRQLRTFDFVIRHLGHGLFPWSAFLPFAIGYALREPFGVSGAALERESALRVTLVVVSAVGLGVHGIMAPTTGHLPFAAVFALAALAGLALRDFDRGAPGSRAMAMGVAALAILLWYDFRTFPEKGLSAFAVSGAKFPDSFKRSAAWLLKASTLAFIAAFFFSFMEQTRAAARRFHREDYLAWPRTLRTAFNGNLWFGLLVVEATLVGLFVLSWLSRTTLHLRQFAQLGSIPRVVVEWGWIGLPALVIAPTVLLLLRDASRGFYARTKCSRAVGAGGSVLACAIVLSLWYYPALAAQISPKQVFDSYRRLSRPDELLATVGVSGGSASYYTGRDVKTLPNASAGFSWLMQGSERRWLVVRQKDLAQLNSLYRRRSSGSGAARRSRADGSVAGGPRNLPVLDARSSEIMLVSNQLRGGEADRNPFNEWILTERPHPARKVDGSFGGQLEALGWEIKTPDGRVVDSISPGRRYTFCIYYEVVRAISGNWETFVHIDGYKRRFNGDHKTLQGKYPFHLWRPGDYIADLHPFRLDPNFTPGRYQVFYGLFIGNRRLEVKRGRHDQNRLRAGSIAVR